MKKILIMFSIASIVIIASVIVFIYEFNRKSYKQYTNSDFNIETYTSDIDKDNDGIDDQTDILNNVKQYIACKPNYKCQCYGTGYPNDG